MNTLNVNLGAHSYPIYIGPDLLAQQNLFTSHVQSKQLAIISNTTVAPLYLDKVKENLGNSQVIEHIIDDGEIYKNLSVLEQLHHQFVRE